ncbi:hypothetical protein CLOP_g5189 [Closterium sp. NIES-67]|nr:hypothetical protein CLOP_g5189 [Closterium sp. NIES-67]
MAKGPFCYPQPSRSQCIKELRAEAEYKPLRNRNWPSGRKKPSLERGAHGPRHLIKTGTPLLTMDILEPGSMKNAAKCDT